MNAPLKQVLLPAYRPATPAASWATRGLFGIGVVFLLDAAEPVLLPILLAVALTFVLSAPVRRLRRHGVSEPVGAALVVGALVCAVALLGAAVASPAAAWSARTPAIVRQITASVESWQNRMRDLSGLPAPVRRGDAPAGAATAAAVSDTLSQQFAAESVSIARRAGAAALTVALQAAATVVLLYFLLASEHWIVSRTVECFHRPRTRALVLGGFLQAQRDIGRYIGTMAVMNVALGVATGLALAAVGLPDPVLWGTATALLTFMPYIGPLLITLLLLLAGHVAFGASAQVLVPPAVFLALHALEANFLSPIVMGRSLRLSALAVFLSVMLWGGLWGVGGTLVAVPVLLGVRAVCSRRRSLRRICVFLEGGAPDGSLGTLIARGRPAPAAEPARPARPG